MIYSSSDSIKKTVSKIILDFQCMVMSTDTENYIKEILNGVMVTPIIWCGSSSRRISVSALLI